MSGKRRAIATGRGAILAIASTLAAVLAAMLASCASPSMPSPVPLDRVATAGETPTGGLVVEGVALDPRIEWARGDTFDWQVEERYAGSAGDGGTTIGRVLAVETTWRVEDVDTDGRATVVQSVDRVRVADDHPARTVRFDSLAESDSERTLAAAGAGDATVRTARDLVGATVRFVVDRSGRISALDFPQVIERATHASRIAAVPRLFAASGWRQALETLAYLPPRAVAPGGVWSFTEARGHALGELESEVSLAYRGRASEVEPHLDLVTFTKQAKRIPAAARDGDLHVEAATANGEIAFAGGRGVVFRFSQRGRMRFADGSGILPNRDVESLVTVRLERRGAR